MSPVDIFVTIAVHSSRIGYLWHQCLSLSTLRYLTSISVYLQSSALCVGDLRSDLAYKSRAQLTTPIVWLSGKTHCHSRCLRGLVSPGSGESSNPIVSG